MSLRSILCRGLLLLAGIGLLLPSSATAAVPATQIVVRDVALGESGTLNGALLDLNGQPIANKTVQVIHENRVVAQAATGAEGEYSVVGLRAGMHIIEADGSQSLCRFWSCGTAPPVATSSLLLLSNEAAVRGNPRKKAVIAHMLSNPWLLIGIGAAAIAIPAIVNGNGANDDSGS